ncbi:hypothetical protein SCHPADRAFT_301775 [Schizopora paradoxa]|uniref:Uncharacterized protein n=1 Tax=Schizopora paradoxa TaxID=27342 RepID=A0A0H2RYT6_9AGAM|nr:hypothetical protein SCHPADRAFT_301775 [Schizopora paradoxa]
MAPSTQYAPSGFKAAQSAASRLPAGTWNNLNPGTRPYPYPVDQPTGPPRPGSSRPPSAGGYRPPTAGGDRDAMSHQYVSTSYHYPGSSNARPPQGRSSTAPTPLQHIPPSQPSSSKSTQESGGSRSVFSKMLSRVKSNSHSAPAPPPLPVQEDKSKRFQRNHRTLSVQATSNPYSINKPSSSNPPPSAPPTTTTWAQYEQAVRTTTAAPLSRQESREDRSNVKLQKSKDKDRAREERHRERDERARAEEKTRAEYVARRMEAEQAAASAKVLKTERPPSRRRTDSKQEYDSDNNVQKPPGYRHRSSEEAHTLDKSRFPANGAMPTSVAAQPPFQNGVPPQSAVSALHPALRYGGVPVLPSTSSHSTSVSSKTLAGGPPPPPKGAPTQIVPGTGTGNGEERVKLIRETEREAYAREREREKDRDRIRDRDRDRQREMEKEARHREREREKEKERDRERENKLEKHRSHRDRAQSQSLPINTPAVVSASDTERERERSGRRESRTHHRSTSHTNGAPPNASGQVPLQQDIRRPDSRRESVQPPSGVGMMMKQQQDTVVYPRNVSSQDPGPSQPVVPQNPSRHPERSRTEPVPSSAYYGTTNHGTSHTTVSISPTTNTQGPPDVPPHHAQTLPLGSHSASAFAASLNPRPNVGEAQPPPSQYLRTDTNVMKPLDKFTSPSGVSSLLSPATFGVLPMSTVPSTSSSMNHHNDRRNSMAPSLLPGQTGQQGMNPHNGSPKSNVVGSQQSVPSSHSSPSNNTNHGTGHVEKIASQGPSSSTYSHVSALAAGRTPSNTSQMNNAASNSPGQRNTLQVPPGQMPASSGVFSRTPSNTSQNESSTPRQAPSTPLTQPGAASLGPANNATMYPTTQNISASSRASHAYPSSNFASVQSTYPPHGVPGQHVRSDHHSQQQQSSMDHSLSQQNVNAHTSAHNVPPQPSQQMPTPYFAPQKTMSSTSAIVNDSMSAANPVVLSQTQDQMYNNTTSPWTDPSHYQPSSVSKGGVPQSFGQAMASRPLTSESHAADPSAGLTAGSSSIREAMSLSPPNSLLTLTNSPGPAANSSGSAAYATSTRQPPGLNPALPIDTPGVGVSAPLTALRTYSQSTPPEAHHSISQPVPRVPSRAEDVAASTRVPIPRGRTFNLNACRFLSSARKNPRRKRDSLGCSALNPRRRGIENKWRQTHQGCKHQVLSVLGEATNFALLANHQGRRRQDLTARLISVTHLSLQGMKGRFHPRYRFHLHPHLLSLVVN